MDNPLAGQHAGTDGDEELTEAREAFREDVNPESYPIFLERMFDPFISLIGQIARGVDEFLAFLFASLGREKHNTDPVTRNRTSNFQHPPFWLYVLLFECIILLLDFSISAMLGELHGIRVEIIPLELFNVLISFCFIVLVKSYFDHFRDDVRFTLIDFVTTQRSLDEIKSWFDSIRKKWAPLICGLAFSLAWILLGPFLVDQIKGDFLGWGPWLLLALANFPIGTGGYYLWISRNFRIQAKSWDFKIFEPNPSKSLVIIILSRLLSMPVAIGAFLSVLVTLAFSITRSFSFLTLLIAVICGWYPMLSLFVRNQIALASIITRAKNRKLFELQNQITEYERQGLTTSDRIEYHKKLIDYHNSIAGTPNSALNFRRLFGFLNTLLLPLVTLLLTNIDVIIRLIWGK